MRHVLCSVLLGLTISSCVGCFVPAYSGDPTRRTQQLIYTSENMRLLMEEWERLWMLDQPSHLSPHRTHGGII
jgi:transcriptional regulator of aromatic amino acid metabolism